MRTASPLAALAVAAAALALAACGGTAHPAGQTPDNVRVCQHYKVQRDRVKNLATPGIADAVQFETWVALDAQQATPGTALKRDLDALSAAQQDASSPASAVYDASVRVLRDCTALGVTFPP